MGLSRARRSSQEPRASLPGVTDVHAEPVPCGSRRACTNLGPYRAVVRALVSHDLTFVLFSPTIATLPRGWERIGYVRAEDYARATCCSPTPTPRPSCEPAACRTSTPCSGPGRTKRPVCTRVRIPRIRKGHPSPPRGRRPGPSSPRRRHQAELNRLGVQHASVFGSVARGDDRSESDLTSWPRSTLAAAPSPSSILPIPCSTAFASPRPATVCKRVLAPMPITLA